MSNLFSDKLPLSYQLAQLIRQQILDGTYRTGKRIPPEVQLAKKYHVSVITVQRALRALEAENLIRRKRGQGTFVSELPRHLATPREKLALEHMFSDEFEESELLERTKVKVPSNLKDEFPNLEQVGMYRRLVYNGGEPFSYTIHHMLPDYLDAFSDEQLRRYPMFRLLWENLDLPLEHVEIKLKSLVASPETSRVLRCDSLSPILMFTGLLYDDSEKVIDVPKIYFRGDRFTFFFDMDLTAHKRSSS